MSITGFAVSRYGNAGLTLSRVSEDQAGTYTAEVRARGDNGTIVTLRSDAVLKVMLDRIPGTT